MELDKIILRDGHIQHYALKNDKLTITIKDYLDNILIMEFHEILELLEFGSVNIDIINYEIKKEGNLYRLILLDDENVIFEIVYKNCYILQPDNRG